MLHDYADPLGPFYNGLFPRRTTIYSNNFTIALAARTAKTMREQQFSQHCRMAPEAGERHKKVRGIRACFINATSLKKHIGYFRQYDTSCNSFGVAESRLGDLVDDHLVKIMGHSIIRQGRNTAGGDVLMYVRNDLKTKILIKAKTT